MSGTVCYWISINMCLCTTAVNVEFTRSEFIVFENASKMIITLEVDHPALTEITVIVVASPDTADGKYIIVLSLLNALYIIMFRFRCGCRKHNSDIWSNGSASKHDSQCHR